MPNFHQIHSLKQKFYQLNKNDLKVKDYIEKSEARNVLRKAFESKKINESLNETRFYSFLNESFNPLKPELIKYFDDAKEEDIVILFIDITSFSKTISGWAKIKLKNFLDDYYERIIPIIYRNGGEIEKLMGDGVICVFGNPFLEYENYENVYKAENCAEEVIKEFYGSEKNVKVAIHKGEVTYYKVPGDQYGEYTMIGQPITDLFRLESVAKPNAINFYDGSSYDKLGWRHSQFDGNLVNCRGFEISDLQGVDFKRIKYMKFPEYN